MGARRVLAPSCYGLKGSAFVCLVDRPHACGVDSHRMARLSHRTVPVRTCGVRCCVCVLLLGERRTAY